MIDELRGKIDEIDDRIARLYDERMALVKEIAIEKQRNSGGVFDGSREKSIINRVTGQVHPDITVFTKQVFETLFETSKAYQSRFVQRESALSKKLREAVENPAVFPTRATVACQGVEGAFSSLAAERLFEISDTTYCKSFEAVFNAVEKGLCDYGVLPIENSTAGSVNAVYDLMKEHKFYVVRSIKQKVSHNLLTNKRASLKDIKEIITHEQAISQCSVFLKKLPASVKITPVSNTASAAQEIALSGRNDIACISSRRCADIYGLSITEANIQNLDNNYTRFICISKKMEIFEHSDKISIMVNLPNEKGSLNKLLNKFSVLGLNLTKLESRPLYNTEFEFMFYFDFDGDPKKAEVQSLLAELDANMSQFVFLGSYKEIQ